MKIMSTQKLRKTFNDGETCKARGFRARKQPSLHMPAAFLYDTALIYMATKMGFQTMHHSRTSTKHQTMPQLRSLEDLRSNGNNKSFSTLKGANPCLCTQLQAMGITIPH